MKVILDQGRCVASGQCVTSAAKVFDQRDEDGIAFLLTDDVTGEEIEAVRDAVAVCPALAIALEG